MLRVHTDDIAFAYNFFPEMEPEGHLLSSLREEFAGSVRCETNSGRSSQLFMMSSNLRKRDINAPVRGIFWA